MGRGYTAVLVDHLEETRGSVPKPGGRVESGLCETERLERRFDATMRDIFHTEDVTQSCASGWANDAPDPKGDCAAIARAESHRPQSEKVDTMLPSGRPRGRT